MYSPSSRLSTQRHTVSVKYHSLKLKLKVNHPHYVLLPRIHKLMHLMIEPPRALDRVHVVRSTRPIVVSGGGV